MIADALLVIDLQVGVCHDDGTIYNYSSLIPRTNERIQQYYQEDKPVIFIRHNDGGLLKDSEDWQVVSELDTSKGLFSNKAHANAFFQTDLEQILKTHNIKSIEVCGAQTEYCVDGTVKFAHGLGYQLYMQHGMTSTYDNEFMTAEQTIQFFEELWDGRYVEFF